jgi:hypothetical protein
VEDLVRRALSVALVAAASLRCLPAFADVVPDPSETVSAVCFLAVALAMVLLVAIWIVVRVRRRRWP